MESWEFQHELLSKSKQTTTTTTTNIKIRQAESIYTIWFVKLQHNFDKIKFPQGLEELKYEARSKPALKFKLKEPITSENKRELYLVLELGDWRLS